MKYHSEQCKTITQTENTGNQELFLMFNNPKHVGAIMNIKLLFNYLTYIYSAMHLKLSIKMSIIQREVKMYYG